MAEAVEDEEAEDESTNEFCAVDEFGQVEEGCFCFRDNDCTLDLFCEFEICTSSTLIFGDDMDEEFYCGFDGCFCASNMDCIPPYECDFGILECVDYFGMGEGSGGGGPLIEDCPICFSDDDCPFSCIEGNCGNKNDRVGYGCFCGGDGDCGIGLYCDIDNFGGLCLDFFEQDECTFDEDCGLDGFCTDGFCEYIGSPGGGGCISNDDCFLDEECVDGFCDYVGVGCVSNEECMLDEECLDGFCEYVGVGCVSNDDCFLDEECLDGFCEPFGPISGGCIDDSDCGSDYYCDPFDGICYFSGGSEFGCIEDIDCGIDYYCDPLEGTCFFSGESGCELWPFDFGCSW